MGDKATLVSELKEKRDESFRLARKNYHGHLALSIVSIAFSAGAVISGQIPGVEAGVVGILGAVPGILVGASTSLRLQDKASWYYVRRAYFDEVRRDLEVSSKYDTPGGLDLAVARVGQIEREIEDKYPGAGVPKDPRV